jgi:CheY-like chemotaxis protein
VDVASDGAEALEAARRTVYDAILMDVQMPGMDGLAATRAIRALGPPHATTRIIALTAAVGPEFEAMCREAGMDEYLTKPTTGPRLLQALRL